MNHLTAMPESFNFSSKNKECHLADKNNKCPHCHKIMANSWYIKQHIKSVHEKLKPFQCDQCFAKFGFQFSLIRHTAKIHQNNTAQHTQSNVYENYKIQSGQVGHYTTNTTQFENVNENNATKVVRIGSYTTNIAQFGNVKIFPCHYCGAKLSSNYHLKSHVLSVHEKWRPFQCDQCFTRFGNKSNLQRHLATVHEINPSIKCNIFQSDLKRHVKHVHENVKPFSCDQCDHKYRSNADLKRHVRCVHENLRPFICSWCTAKFGDNFSLKRHSNKLHANEEQNNLQNLNEGVNFILDLSMTKRISIKS